MSLDSQTLQVLCLQYLDWADSKLDSFEEWKLETRG